MKSHSKRKRVFRPPTSDFPFPTSTLASDFRRHAFAAESCILMRQLDIAVRHHEFISLSVFSFFFFSQSCLSTKRLEIYACDWITTLSEQQLHCRQTLKNSFLSIVFFHFQRLFVVKQALVTGHFTLTSILAINENHSRKRPRGVRLSEIILLRWGEW